MRNQTGSHTRFLTHPASPVFITLACLVMALLPGCSRQAESSNEPARPVAVPAIAQAAAPPAVPEPVTRPTALTAGESALIEQKSALEAALDTIECQVMADFLSDLAKIRDSGVPLEGALGNARESLQSAQATVEKRLRATAPELVGLYHSGKYSTFADSPASDKHLQDALQRVYYNDAHKPPAQVKSEFFIACSKELAGLGDYMDEAKTLASTFIAQQQSFNVGYSYFFQEQNRAPQTIGELAKYLESLPVPPPHDAGVAYMFDPTNKQVSAPVTGERAKEVCVQLNLAHAPGISCLAQNGRYTFVAKVD